MDGLTRQIAAFVAGEAPAHASRRAVEAAVTGMLDCIGVAIAGCDEPAPRLVGQIVAERQGEDAAPVLPTGRMLAPADAALVNGVAAHVLDYDDVVLDGQPSVALMPAIIAQGWASGASGRDAVAAYIAGYETWALLESTERGALHERGFHPTAVTGTIAAAAAAARLQRLDPERTVHALGIAASLASGLVANFGTMTKSIHAGRVGQSGVLAARLAADGFTASPDALEHPTGFLCAHSPSGRPQTEVTARLGEEWRIERSGVHIKRYPICYATHRSIDAMIGLAEAHDLALADVEEIHTHIGRTQALMLRNGEPRTGLEAKFSMQFAMASALLCRRVGLAELDTAFVTRQDVVDAMRKVRITTTEETMQGLPFAPADRLTVRLKNGETIAHAPVEHAKGSWESPLSPDELRAKFLDCCRDRLPDGQTEALFSALLALEAAPSLRRLPLVRLH